MGQFTTKILEIDAGWCNVELCIDGEKIVFDASYLGENPIETLLRACVELKEFAGYECDFMWVSEPGELNFRLYYRDDSLSIDITEQVEETILNTWHVETSFNDFVNMVIAEAFEVLRKYGLYGYRTSWAKGMTFPIDILAQLLLDNEFVSNENLYNTDFSKEINSIMAYMSNGSKNE